MKKLIYLGLLMAGLARHLPVNGQHDVSQHEADVRYELSCDINDRANRQKLSDKLDEIKADLHQKQEALQKLTESADLLRQRERTLSEVSPGILSQSLMHIAEALHEHDLSRQLLEEHRLKVRLTHLLEQFDTADSLLFPEDHSPGAGVVGLAAAAAPMSGSSLLRAFLDHPPESCFLNDSVQINLMYVFLCRGEVLHLTQVMTLRVHAEQAAMADQKAVLEQEIGVLEDLKGRVEDKLKDDVSIDLYSILLGLPLFCFTIVFLFIGPGWIQSRFGKGTLNPLLERSQAILLDLSTVLLLTMSVLILGLSGNINGDVLGTLIGGISGYVLNKSKA